MYTKEQFLSMSSEHINELEDAIYKANRQGKETFKFKQQTFNTRYAKYFLEYVKETYK